MTTLSPTPTSPIIRNDEPIDHAESDTLGRSKLAKVLIEELDDLDATSGAIMAIMGPWGSGKTSLLNLMTTEIERENRFAVVRFNPWMFSGSEELVERFFGELADQRGKKSDKLKDIATKVGSYGSLLKPLRFVPGVATFAEAGGAVLETFSNYGNRQPGITETRYGLRLDLESMSGKILVVIDDVDRLSPMETADVFRLVRLVGNFPNVVYLIAFDRGRVETSLSSVHGDGTSYLEKIVQFPFELPEIADTVLEEHVRSEISRVTSDIAAEFRIDYGAWSTTLPSIVMPLIKNLRDIRRLSPALRVSLRSLEGRVDLGDVIAMETIRLLRPSLFRQLSQVADALVLPKQSGLFSRHSEEQLTLEITRLLESQGDERQFATTVISHLFPLSSERQGKGPDYRGTLEDLKRNDRIGFAPVLGLYLNRTAGSLLESIWKSREITIQADDLFEVKRLFDTTPDTTLRELLQEIPQVADSANEIHVENLLAAGLESIGRLPEFSSVMFERSVRGVVWHYVFGLLRGDSTPPNKNQLVEKVYDKIDNLSAKQIVLEVATYEGEQYKAIVSQEVSERLALRLRIGIENATPASLQSERFFASLLEWQVKQTGTAFPSICWKEASFGRALLMAISHPRPTEVSLQPGGGYLPRSLLWEDLLAIVGGVEAARELIDLHRDDSSVASIVAMADRYLSGDRPDIINR